MKNEQRTPQPFEQFPELAAAIEHGAKNWGINTGWTRLLEQINKVCAAALPQQGYTAEQVQQLLHNLLTVLGYGFAGRDEIIASVIASLSAPKPEAPHCTTDCRSEVGITVGLVDAIISTARVLAPRLKGEQPKAISEALRDLRNDEDVAAISAKPEAPEGGQRAQDEYTRIRIKELVEEEEIGYWQTCSGCHETEDGHDVGHYPFSETFRCKQGSGCGECGGIGVVWNYSHDEHYDDVPAAPQGEGKQLDEIRDALEDLELFAAGGDVKLVKSAAATLRRALYPSSPNQSQTPDHG